MSGVTRQAPGFRQGARISTKFGRELRIIEELGRGGQGIVYKVACGDKAMALKWYYPNALPADSERRERFVRNLNNNVLHGSPSRTDFLWPIDLTEEINGTFGYLMELAPQGFRELNKVLLDPNSFATNHRVVDVCLGIVSAVEKLHEAGFRYQDLKTDNIFVNTHTGKVLLCDNDNACPEGKSTGIVGTVGYMAPEIMLAEDPNPTIQSDLHSMAVVIFYTLVLQHPLQGKRFAETPLNYDGMRYVYGTHPLFIFDEDDASNAPVQSPQSNALFMWPLLPVHMQRLFSKAFSQESLHRAGARPIESVWMYELVRLRSEVMRCRCGNEVFLESDTLTKECERCGCTCSARLFLEVPVGRTPNNRVPVVDDARLYRCQVQRICNAGQHLEPLLWAQASRRDPRDIALRNVSREPWEACARGQSVQVEPQQMIRAIEGMEIKTLGKTVRVCRNQGTR